MVDQNTKTEDMPRFWKIYLLFILALSELHIIIVDTFIIAIIYIQSDYVYLVYVYKYKIEIREMYIRLLQIYIKRKKNRKFKGALQFFEVLYVI